MTILVAQLRQSQKNNAPKFLENQYGCLAKPGSFKNWKSLTPSASEKSGHQPLVSAYVFGGDVMAEKIPNFRRL